MILLSPEYVESRLVPISAFIPEPLSGYAPQSLPTPRYADHATSAGSLARYGVERNPGPDTTTLDTEADAVLPI